MVRGGIRYQASHAGGKERISSILTPELLRAARIPGGPQAQKELVARLHRAKTEIYRKMIQSGRLPPRPGVARIAREALTAGSAIGRGFHIRRGVGPCRPGHRGDERNRSELPRAGGGHRGRQEAAPDIYLLALEKLHVEANEALIIEDSQNGVAAATAAGVRCVVTLSSYTVREDMSEALLVVSDLGEPTAPLRVISNRSRAHPGACMTLGDLADCLR